MRGRPLVMLLVVLALGGACGGGGGGDGGGGNGDSAAAGNGGGDGILVGANEYAFDPAQITAPAGKVTFDLKNTGSMQHDLAIDEPEFKVTALPGQTKSGTVELEAGTYPIYCTIAGHKAAGMEGTLTVE